MRFIILAAGQGTRMLPFAKVTPKCLLQLERGETTAARKAQRMEMDDLAEDARG